MKRSAFRIAGFVVGVSCLACFISGQAAAFLGGKEEKAAPAAQSQPAPEAAKQVLTGAALYTITPEPLTPRQCGQCHATHFAYLQKDGRKHQFECQNCHQKFHAYNPVKGNWADLMPKCEQCHTSPPHGQQFLNCLSCHTNPHTPRVVPSTDNLTPFCGQCHTGPSGQLQQFPSKHTQQPCDSCHHDRHGYIPNCMECHEPHLQGQTIDVCLSCHAVHKPLQIALTQDSSVETCNVCHDAVYGKWKATQSKHGKVACGSCHQAHGKIPECTMCHTAPHDASILSKFPRCLDCHIDVHDLPIKK
jgi:hypothetical protein